MADEIEPIQGARKRQGTYAAELMMAQLMAHRQNSVLLPQADPEDTVQRDPLLRIARTSAAYQKVLAQEMAQAALTVQDAELLKTETYRASSVHQEESDKERGLEKAAEHHAISSAKKRGKNLAQDQSGTSSGGQQHHQHMAFAQAGGEHLLTEAGEDPILIRQALDTLARAGIDSDLASRLYQESLLNSLRSRPVLVQLEEAPEPPGPKTPVIQPTLSLGPVDSQADEVPWNITPVKT